MKKIIAAGLMIGILFSGINALAIPYVGSFNGNNGKIDVNVNGDYLDFDVNPIMQNNRVLVPMRTIFEKLGARVYWDQNSNTVTAKNDYTTINLKVGENFFTKNNQKIPLDVSAQIVSGRTLIPIRAISEALDASVSWFGYDEEIVTISTYPISTDDAIKIAQNTISGKSATKIEVREICCMRNQEICYHVRMDHNMMLDDWPIAKSYYISVNNGQIISSAG